jgi:hypothetical protein
VHYTLRFENSELELVDTRGFTLPEHWRSELLPLVRGQSLPLRKGDEWGRLIQVRNILQDAIKPRRARVALLVLRGDKAGSDHFDQYRKMGETLDGVVPYLYVITYARLPADLDVTRLAKKLGAKSTDVVFPIELYSCDDPAPNEERNGRMLSLLLHVIAEAETQGKLIIVSLLGHSNVVHSEHPGMYAHSCSMCRRRTLRCIQHSIRDCSATCSGSLDSELDHGGCREQVNRCCEMFARELCGHQ